MSSGDYSDELSKEEFEKIINRKNEFFLTGTRQFFGKGNDIDFVIPIEKWDKIMGFKPDIISPEFMCYYYCEYDFIVVCEQDFKRWKMATETACILIEKDKDFKKWFQNKGNRQAYFKTFLYGWE